MGLVLVAKTPDGIDIFYDDTVSGFTLGANEVQTAIDILKMRNPFAAVTHRCNAAGHILKTYDEGSDSHLASDPNMVIDVNGDIVLSGGY
jgi:hypothetical protein